MSLSVDINPILDREGWLKERRNYLGATDMAALVGKHKYKTALDVFLEKTGQKTDDAAGRKAQAGLALEPLIRQWYSEEIGHPIGGNRMIVDAEHDFLRVNLDGEVMDGSGDPVEIKTMDFATRDRWGMPGSDEIPPQYYVQAIVQLGTTGRERCHVVKCDRGTMEIDAYYVYADPDNYHLIRSIGIDFWLNKKCKGIPPAATERDGDNIVYLFPNESGEMLISDPAIDDLASRMASIYRIYKDSEKEYDALKSEMKVLIGAASGITTLTGDFKLARCAGKTKWKDVAISIAARLNCPKELMTQLLAEFTGERYTQLKTPF